VKRAFLATLLLLGACSTPVYDYGPYLSHMPRSILVLPPINDSEEVKATYGWLSTVTLPLAERGYYVFPVAVIDELLKQNGMPTAMEMQSVPLDKVREIIGADAVLYTRIREWGTSYQLVNSQTKVLVDCYMVDVDTGTEIWRVSRSAVYNSNSGDVSLPGIIINSILALVEQIASDVSDYATDVGAQVNGSLASGYDGMLIGPYHPRYAEDQQLQRDALAARQKEAAEESAAVEGK
jgi:hypothetical protein